MEQILAQYGLAGLVIATLCTVVVYQNRFYEKKLDIKEKRIEELQDLRLTDTRKTAEDITEVLQGNAQSIRILTEKIEIARGKNVVA